MQRVPTPSSSPQQIRMHMGWLLLVALAFTLAGCEVFRFRSMTPVAPSSPVAPIDTPTLAPALLTPPLISAASPVAPASSVSPTPTFGLPLPEPTCESTPEWGLGDVWKNEGVHTRLGCPIADQIGIQGEELYFQNGHMLWRPDAGLIYVLNNDPRQPEGWGAFADTFRPGDPDSDPSIAEPTPPSGVPVYMQPQGRFGKLWRENPWLRAKLGWALVPYELGRALPSLPFQGTAQDCERGVLFWNGKSCFVLYTDDMSWDVY